jgi:Na+-transporting NADH:ubiquinone oxidoreductase subunit F
MPSGEIKLVINDEKEFTVAPGSTVLTTLANEKIFLPSACGGGGTCAMCKCQVFEGGGSILPTEVGYFTRKEQQNNWRLGCQVKVKENMKIGIPKEIFGIKKWECEVISNRNVATFIKEFVVRLPEGETLDFRSGGYIQIDVPKCEVDFKDMVIEEKYRGDWDNFKMWDLKMKNPEPIFRAYSMANHPAEGNIVMLNIRIATPPFDRVAGGFKNVNPGICSSYVFSRKAGDKVTVSGPYGEFFIKPTEREMMFIGGLSEPLPEDHWDGYTGFIHQIIMDNYLKTHPEPEEIEYYLCGPPMMNDAVLKMLDDYGVPQEMIAFDDFGG